MQQEQEQMQVQVQALGVGEEELKHREGRSESTVSSASTATCEEEPKIHVSKSRMNGRYNSTSTVHVRETMAHPDAEATLVSVAKVIRKHIKNGERKLEESVTGVSQKKGNLQSRDPNTESGGMGASAGDHVVESEIGKRRKVSLNGDAVVTASGATQESEVDEVVLRMRKLVSDGAQDEEQDDDDDFDDTLSQDGGVEFPETNRSDLSNLKEVEKAARSFLKFGKFFDRISLSTSPFAKLLKPKANDTSKKTKSIPSTREIFRFMKNIYTTAQCSVDCTIVSLIYVDRFTGASGLNLTCLNWKSIIMTAMLLASKVWDDLSMVNIDFSIFLPFSLAQINTWERQFLAGMKYNVRVSTSQYAQCYFEARLSTTQRRFERAKRLKRVKQTEMLQQAVNAGDSKLVNEILSQMGKGSGESPSKKNCSGGEEEDVEFLLPEVPINLEQAKKLEIVSTTMEKRLLEMKALLNSIPKPAAAEKGKHPVSGTNRRVVSDRFFARGSPESAPRFIID